MKLWKVNWKSDVFGGVKAIAIVRAESKEEAKDITLDAYQGAAWGLGVINGCQEIKPKKRGKAEILVAVGYSSGD